MFETSLVRGRVTTAAHRYRFLTLSLALHSCAVTAILTATLITTRLPTESPRLMEPAPFLPVVPLPPPPRLGQPDAPERAKPAPPAAQPKQMTAPPATIAPADAVPTSIPQQSATSDPVSTTTAEGGTGTGIERGIPEGVPDGSGTDRSAIGNPVLPDAPIRVIGDVKAPVAIQRVLPVYPQIAMRGRIEGWVIVECIIDRTGHIREARAVRSSFAPFEQSAVDAVQQWVFKPGTLHGEPVDVIFNLTVTFNIQR